jgi:hypothetical protein
VGAAALWAGALIRRHWRATAALALVFGLAFGFIGAAFAAERRADTALDRYAARRITYQVAVASCPPGADPSTFGQDYTKYIRVCLSEQNARRAAADLAHLPDVESTTYGAYHVIGVLDPHAPNGWGRVGLLISTKTRDAGLGENEPIIVSGRTPRPGAPDEIVVSETAEKDDGIHVGDRLSIGSWKLDELDQAVQRGIRPDLRPVHLRVVGVGRFNNDLSTNGDPDVSGSQLSGQLYGTGGTAHLFRQFANYGDAALVELRTGRSGKQALEDELGRHWKGRFFQVQDTLDVDPSVIQHEIDNERRAVIVVAAITFAATIGFAGLTLVRQLGREQHELPVLRALGFDRGDLVRASLLRTLTIAAPAAVLAAVVTVALSPLEPVGLARRADPDVGFHVDGLAALAAFGAAAVVVCAFGAAVPLILRRRRESIPRPRPRTEAAAIRLGPSATTGYALAGGNWRRVAAVVTVLAVAGLVAAGVTVRSLDHVLDRPVRYGAWWDLVLGDYSDPGALRHDIPIVLHQPGVVEAAGIAEQEETATIDGHGVPLMGFVPYRGDPQPVMARGRAPRTTHEIALGQETMAAVHAHIGDTVVLAPTKGSSRARRTMKVTGQVVLDNPIQLSLGAGDGAYVLPSVISKFSPSLAQSIAVRFAPGVDRDAALARLARTYHGAIHPVAAQDDLRNMNRLRNVPWAIAGLLSLLALATVVHALVTMVSGNRRNLAMLTVLGAPRSMRARATLWAAAFTVAGAVVLGVPAGLVIGRALWRFLAHGIAIPSEPVTPLLTALGLAAGVLVLSEAVAWAALRRYSGRDLAGELRQD